MSEGYSVEDVAHMMGFVEDVKVDARYPAFEELGRLGDAFFDSDLFGSFVVVDRPIELRL